MSYRACSVVVATLLACSSGSALAVTKSFYINGSDLRTNFEPETREQFNGVALNQNAPTAVIINFTLPKGYKKNSTIKVRPRMFVADTGCSVVLSADGTYRYRPGLFVPNLGSPESGLSIVGSEEIVAPATASAVFTKTFDLNKPTSGPLLSQAAGDNIVVFIGRQGADPDDDCAANLMVTSVKITYEVN